MGVKEHPKCACCRVIVVLPPYRLENDADGVHKIIAEKIDRCVVAQLEDRIIVVDKLLEPFMDLLVAKKTVPCGIRMLQAHKCEAV